MLSNILPSGRKGQWGKRNKKENCCLEKGRGLIKKGMWIWLYTHINIQLDTSEEGGTSDIGLARYDTVC